MLTMIPAFIYGTILAFGLILPLGVQNIFIFNQGASQKHFFHALPSVITAALCDCILILLAVLGVSVIVLSIAWLKLIFFVVGFFFLSYMGYITWKSKPTLNQLNVQEPLSAKRQIVFSLSASLLNPHAIMDTIGVIGTNALQFTDNSKIAFTLACMFVSCSWFFGLSVLGHTLHKIDKNGRWLGYLNQISAVIIWSIAIFIGWQIFKVI